MNDISVVKGTILITDVFVVHRLELQETMTRKDIPTNCRAFENRYPAMIGSKLRW